MCEALGKPRYLRWLLGVGGSWMLYDITQYGLKIFGPVLCENIFGESESIVAVCWQNIVLNAMAIPGYYLTIKCLNAWGPKRVQMFSFVLMAVMFLVTGLFAHFVPKGVVNRRVVAGICLAHPGRREPAATPFPATPERLSVRSPSASARSGGAWSPPPPGTANLAQPPCSLPLDPWRLP